MQRGSGLRQTNGWLQITWSLWDFRFNFKHRQNTIFIFLQRNILETFIPIEFKDIVADIGHEQPWSTPARVRMRVHDWNTRHDVLTTGWGSRKAMSHLQVNNAAWQRFLLTPLELSSIALEAVFNDIQRHIIEPNFSGKQASLVPSKTVHLLKNTLNCWFAATLGSARHRRAHLVSRMRTRTATAATASQMTATDTTCPVRHTASGGYGIRTNRRMHRWPAMNWRICRGHMLPMRGVWEGTRLLVTPVQLGLG